MDQGQPRTHTVTHYQSTVSQNLNSSSFFIEIQAVQLFLLLCKHRTNKQLKLKKNHAIHFNHMYSWVQIEELSFCLLNTVQRS